jgi:YbbR domain-containing protein
MLKRLLLFIIRDPIRKIFAIIFAFGLWLFVVVDNDYRYERNLKIIYSGLADSLIVTDSMTEINVEFNGRGRNLFTIWLLRPKVLCNLADAHRGENKIPIRNLFIPLTFSDVVINYGLKSLDIKVDEKIDKEIKLSVPFRGTPKKGFTLSKIVSPSSVHMTGPRELLRVLTELTADSVNLDNVNLTFEKPLSIITPSPLIKVASAPAMIRVETDSAVQKFMTDLPIKVINPAGKRVSLDRPAVDTLIIEGPKSEITRLARSDIEIRIRISDRKPGYYLLPAEVILPDYFRPVYSSPKKFGIRIY